MDSVIKILPENLVNKIAAGEVVERPASVVKELVENSIDAQASDITINIQQAGRNLIQVIDNGIGMSPADARLAFEHHATSKISNIKDLFSIRTKGFRGEALSSIAAVSQVELKTRREQDSIGTRIVIEGGKLILQEPVNCPKGANFSVKNLFFNVPARRKFLKSDATEFRHILNEFYRIAIPHPKVRFSLYHNDQLIYKLNESTLKERIVSLFDKNYSKYLIPVESDGGFIKIYGYIGTPEAARKRFAEQYFFVNNRYFKSSYLHRAVMRAYEKILPADTKPLYFIFFQIDPSRVDVNIHPRKIEVNFQDADAIYQLLLSAIKKALAQYGIIPMLNFDIDQEIENIKPNEELLSDYQGIDLPEDYNPFNYSTQKNDFTDSSPAQSHTTPDYHREKKVPENWEQVLKIVEQTDDQSQTSFLDTKTPATPKSNFINHKGKFIITAIKSGLVIIHQQRALETIFFNQIIDQLSNTKISSQQTLYPIKINLNPHQLQLFYELKSHLEAIGFTFERMSERAFNITGIPAFLDLNEVEQIFWEIINDPDANSVDLQQMTLENIALLLAKSRVKLAGYRKLSPEEMEDIANKIFALNTSYSPSGNLIFYILKTEDIDKFFKS